MDDFDLELKTEFINEALMNLEEAEGSFMELESSANPKELLDKIFRVAHNLKGGSRAVGFGDVAEFTHQLENLVQKIQKGGVALNSDVVTILLRSNDRLVEMLSQLKGNLEAKFDNSDLLVEIQGAIEGKLQGSTRVAPAVVVESALAPSAPAPSAEFAEDLVAEEIPAPTEAPPEVPDASAFFDSAPSAPAPNPAAPQVAPQVATPPSQSKGSNQKVSDDEIVRVSLSKVDGLNDSVGELIVLQSVIQQQSLTGDMRTLQASIRQMVKLSKDIQDLSMSLRMLPVKPLVQKLQRVVRDTAKALDKDVSFEVLGEQMEIDKSVLDRLADPLIHILRNAVDHGLETTNERIEAGKSPQGQVLLSFGNEGNNLVVEIRDNGKGINAKVLEKKAVEKGLIPEINTLTEKQLVHLIFHPGFSTKAVTSEISGRGVGMDVVKTNIEKVGGQVDVITEVGKGSVFRLQIPLSLAVIEGMIVTSSAQRYVVPLSQVQETINLQNHQVQKDKLGIGACLDLRGAVVPLVRIDDALGEKSVNEDFQTGLIVKVGQRPIALLVREVVRSQQIVIKPLSNGIRAQKGWIGSCILGDGLPTLILSPTDLLEKRLMGGTA
ncbi:MAG: chemotaxis protein CheA [Bdellovibrionales bacterium]